MCSKHGHYKEGSWLAKAWEAFKKVLPVEPPVAADPFTKHNATVIKYAATEMATAFSNSLVQPLHIRVTAYVQSRLRQTGVELTADLVRPACLLHFRAFWFTMVCQCSQAACTCVQRRSGLLIVQPHGGHRCNLALTLSALSAACNARQEDRERYFPLGTLLDR